MTALCPPALPMANPSGQSTQSSLVLTVTELQQEDAVCVSSPSKSVEGIASIVDAKATDSAKKPYSVFTSREKWTIVFMASFAGLFR